MRCPKCGGKTRVPDSRPSGEQIRRRHICKSCDHAFTTYEFIVQDVTESLGPKNPLQKREEEILRRDELIKSLRGQIYTLREQLRNFRVQKRLAA